MDNAYIQSRYGSWAVIAGASQGIGEQFSLQLATMGLNLLMIARGKEGLDKLADQIRGSHSVKVETLSLDLADPQLESKLRAATDDKEVGLMVYNAVYSHIGEFFEDDLASKQLCLDVNCRGPLTFLEVLARPMKERKRGGIILMSSMSGFQGSAMVTNYAATKAYNTVLAEGLWEELRHYGITVLSGVAGATKTPNFNAQTPKEKAGSAFPMEPEAVVTEILQAFVDGKGPTYIAGRLNRAVRFVLERFLTRKIAVTFLSSTTRKLYM